MSINNSDVKVGLDLRSCLFSDLPSNRLSAIQIYERILDDKNISDSILGLINHLATRAEWQELRLQSYNDNISLSNDQIAKQAKVFSEHSALLKGSIPGYHPVHGKEPSPFVNMEGRRFVNDDWCAWYSCVTDSNNRQATLTDCCKRGMELLYPTAESREGLEWELGLAPGRLSKYNTWIFPMEVVFYRTVIQKV